MADMAFEAQISEETKAQWKRRPKNKKITLDMKAARARREDTRDRKDSGCCMDETPSADSILSSDAAFLHWNEIIFNWSAKSHLIIQQEFERMQAMTEKMEKEMSTANPKERVNIIEGWKREVAGMMEVAQDLIQCVANDIVETNSSSDEEDSRRASTTLNSNDLGKILEEELSDEKVFLVRAKNSKPKNKSKKMDLSKVKGAEMWAARRSFTLEVEELEKNDWRKDLESPIIWKDSEIVSEQDDLEVEDIFADWIQLLRRQNPITKHEKSIDDVFWDISLGKLTRKNKRQRRLSDVLDNLPFQDQPDIFGDRCEILEVSKKRKIRQEKRRPAKCYWNIFEEWKRNLDEERAMKRKQARNRRQRRRPKQRYPRKKKPSKGIEKKVEKPKEQFRLGRPRRASINLIEDYFQDFKPNFAENGKRPREDEFDYFHSPKRQKTFNWQNIRNESERSLRAITRNIEAKIREAFEVDLEPQGSLDLEEELSFHRMISNSNEEFCLLRDQVRSMRRENQNRRRRNSNLTAFQEWRWNLAESDGTTDFVIVTPVEDIFQDWLELTESKVANDDSEDEGFEDSDDLEERRRSLRQRSNSYRLEKAGMKMMNKQNLAREVALCHGEVPSRKEIKKLNSNAAFKAQKRLRVKCQPKQPMLRGKN